MLLKPVQLHACSADVKQQLSASPAAPTHSQAVHDARCSTQHSFIHTANYYGVQVYFNRDDLDSTDISPGTLRHGFSSIPNTLWFMVVTMMTVGYGDLVPKTLAGQMITCVAMVLAMLVLALPISVVGTNFTQVRATAHWTALEAAVADPRACGHGSIVAVSACVLYTCGSLQHL